MEIRQAVAAGEMAEREAHELMRSYVLPTRPLPVVCRIGGAFIPAIYDPTISTEWLRFERFPRKAKGTEQKRASLALLPLARPWTPLPRKPASRSIPCAPTCVTFWRRPGANAKPKLSRC